MFVGGLTRRGARILARPLPASEAMTGTSRLSQMSLSFTCGGVQVVGPVEVGQRCLAERGAEDGYEGWRISKQKR